MLSETITTTIMKKSSETIKKTLNENSTRTSGGSDKHCTCIECHQVISELRTSWVWSDHRKDLSLFGFLSFKSCQIWSALAQSLWVSNELSFSDSKPKTTQNPLNDINYRDSAPNSIVRQIIHYNYKISLRHSSREESEDARINSKRSKNLLKRNKRER